MKPKFLIALLIAFCLCLSACATRNTDNASSSNSPTSETADGETGSQSNETIERESSSQSTLSEKTQSATFFIAGNNAQGTSIKIDIPESWIVDGDKIIANEQFVARFEIAFVYDYDPAEFLQDRIMETEGYDAVIEELDIPGMVVRYCETQIEDADGMIRDGLRYYVCIGNKMVMISFVPALEAEMNLQKEEFETYLATLEM